MKYVGHVVGGTNTGRWVEHDSPHIDLVDTYDTTGATHYIYRHVEIRLQGELMFFWVPVEWDPELVSLTIMRRLLAKVLDLQDRLKKYE